MIAPNEQPGGPEKPLRNAADTSNWFEVARRVDGVVIIHRPAYRLTRDEAINLAAWLAAISDSAGKDFERVLGEVKKG